MTIKGDVNKKWTSTDKYRTNFDKIFGRKDSLLLPPPCDECDIRGMLGVPECICDVLINWEQANKGKEEK